LEVYSNCRNISLRLKRLKDIRFFNKNFAVINFNRVGSFLAKDMLMPRTLELTNKNQYIFSLISSRIKVKSVLNIEVRFKSVQFNLKIYSKC
jgi:hypothetical protein